MYEDMKDFAVRLSIAKKELKASASAAVIVLAKAVFADENLSDEEVASRCGFSKDIYRRNKKAIQELSRRVFDSKEAANA